MAPRWLKVAPESFQGRLYLLFWDKLILGAVIALALLAYDQWKTADQRDYDDKVTLAFRRAEYVKQLVPMVVDRNQDLIVRAQATRKIHER